MWAATQVPRICGHLLSSPSPSFRALSPLSPYIAAGSRRKAQVFVDEQGLARLLAAHGVGAHQGAVHRLGGHGPAGPAHVGRPPTPLGHLLAQKLPDLPDRSLTPYRLGT